MIDANQEYLGQLDAKQSSAFRQTLKFFAQENVHIGNIERNA